MVDKDFLNDIEEQAAINEIVELGFAGRKGSKSWLKQWIVAIAVMIIGIPALGFAFPALAQHIPIIGGIFERIDLHEHDRFVGLADYATVIGQTQVADGVSVTLSEAFFDGQQVYISYLIESDKALNDLSIFEEVNVGLIIDGTWMPANYWPNYYAIDNYSFLFVLIIEPGSMNDLIGASEIEFTSNLLRIIGLDEGNNSYILAEGSWNFRVPLVSVGHDRVVVNQTINQDGFTIQINNLTFSPAGVRLRFSCTLPHPIFSHGIPFYEQAIDEVVAGIDWIIIDDLGNQLKLLEMTTSHANDSYSATGRSTFMPPHSGARLITITPVIYTYKDIQIYEISEAFYLIKSYEIVERIELESIVIDLP